MFTNQPILTRLTWGSLIMAGVSASAQVAGPAGQVAAPGVPQVRQFLQQQLQFIPGLTLERHERRC